jgi:beta-glucosidase
MRNDAVTKGRFLHRQAGRTLGIAISIWCGLVCVVGSGRLRATAAEVEPERLQCLRQAEALLGRMTLEEKLGQMTQVDMKALKDKSDLKTYFIGSVLSGGDSDPADITAAGWAKAVEEFQSWAFRTRLKIPLLYGIDAVHGHNNVDGAVIFPHNIGLGATRNPELLEQAGRVTAQETAATGVRWTFAPCIAVAQNARWGRTYESFGEKPELAALLGVATIRGLQGDSLAQPTSVLACAKHFLGDGGTRDGVDQGNTECDEATLRQIHLPGYAAAIRAGVGSIMVSYSSWNGKKMHANKYLLSDVLKGELGFQGIVVSDWAAIDQLSGDYKTDIEMAINAGLDMVMIPAGPDRKNNYVDFIRLLKELVAENRVPQARIDDAVRRVLCAKFQLGLFEEPFADRRLLATVGSSEHRAVARDCVRQSLVLLRNTNSVLPLPKKLKRLHVAGKAAADLGMQCGGWTVAWQGRSGEVTHGGTTLLAAIRNTVSPGTEVTFSTNASGAAGADAVIAVIGELPYAEMMGDRKDLRLAADDVGLVRELKRTGIPVVTIVLSGRPLILGQVLDCSDALVAAWLPGTEGQGVADVLFGDYAPTGKLPCTWPRSMEHWSAQAVAGTEAPLFPYGFGLTYASPNAAKQNAKATGRGRSPAL